jgi:hypothetical protein
LNQPLGFLEQGSKLAARQLIVEPDELVMIAGHAAADSPALILTKSPTWNL